MRSPQRDCPLAGVFTSAGELGTGRVTPYHTLRMQKLGRLLTLLVVLALGFGTSLHAFAAPAPMDAAGMTAESHAAMADSGDARDGCSACVGEPGLMEDCLPTCMNVPALAPQEAACFFWHPASYNFPAEESFSGTHSRPDPYPPRPIILS